MCPIRLVVVVEFGTDDSFLVFGPDVFWIGIFGVKGLVHDQLWNWVWRVLVMLAAEF